MKKMNLKTTTLAASLFAILSASAAYCGSITLLGDVNFAKPSYSPDLVGTDVSSKDIYGGGILVEGTISGPLGLELGGLYAPRKYKFEVGSSETDITQKMIEVPLLLRVHFGDFFSIGGGGYYSFYLGDVNYDTAGGTSSNSYSGANLTRTDYGFATSAAFYLPLGSNVKLDVEGRYDIGMKDNFRVDNGASMKFREWLGIVGLRFNM